MHAIAVVTFLALACSCGGSPPIPARGVVEGDLGSWKFRRYQPVLDVEVYVSDNPAVAYTASYVSAEAEKRGRIDDGDLVNVFVTRYQKPAGVLRETVRLSRRLAQEAGYRVDESKIGGARLLTISGNGETWAMWPARRHVVKVGGRNRDSVPESMIEAYADRYPSILPQGALEGPLPEPEVDNGQPTDESAPDSTGTPDIKDVNTDELNKKIDEKKRRDNK